MGKAKSEIINETLRAVYSKVTGFDDAEEVLTVLKQVESLVVDLGTTVEAFGRENKTKTTSITTLENKVSTLETDLATAKNTISESDTEGLQAKITTLQTEKTDWTKERSDRVKARLEVIAKHPQFKTIQETGVFKGISIDKDTSKVVFAEDLKPEAILEMGDKAEEYIKLGVFGKVNELDTPQDQRLHPDDKPIEVTDRSSLGDKITTGLKEYT